MSAFLNMLNNRSAAITPFDPAESFAKAINHLDGVQSVEWLRRNFRESL
jgi:hypothetical protein